MGRMCRSSCTLALLACVIIAAVWVTSYRAKAILRLPVSAGSTRFEVYTYRGQLAISMVGDFPVTQEFECFLMQSHAGLAARWDTLFWADSWAGFSAENGHTWVPNAAEESVTRHWLNVIFPYWLILSAALLVPAHAGYLALRARRRMTQGLCTSCGYAYDHQDGSDECPACAARRHVVGLTPRTHLA